MTECDHDPAALSALIDGELDAVHAAQVEARLTACRTCAAEFEEMMAMRAALRSDGARVGAPAGLKARIARTLAVSEAPPAPTEAVVVPFAPRRSRSLAWMGGGAGLAVAVCAGFLFVAMMGQEDAGLTRELVADHVRSLQVSHLVDVQTSDQHVVKPWFNGKLDFAPPAPDLKDRGFPLVGGRLDYLDHRTVAAVVYGRGRHLINLFIWPGRARTGEAVRRSDGYTLRFWRAGGLTFCAVSDVNPADLALFEQEMKGRTGV
jgi:anti-sigma factor RsiW